MDYPHDPSWVRKTVDIIDGINTEQVIYSVDTIDTQKYKIFTNGQERTNKARDIGIAMRSTRTNDLLHPRQCTLFYLEGPEMGVHM